MRHIKFSENYRLYSRSHFVKGYLSLSISTHICTDVCVLVHTCMCLFIFLCSIHINLCSAFRLEVVLLLVVYLAYGYNDGGTLSYILLTVSSWFMALSWLFAPYLFNPSGFEWQK